MPNFELVTLTATTVKRVYIVKADSESEVRQLFDDDKLSTNPIEDIQGSTTGVLSIEEIEPEPDDGMINFYVFKSDGGKFADGHYGWDSGILSDAQIFAEKDLPYHEHAGIRSILICRSPMQPSVTATVNKLKELGEY